MLPHLKSVTGLQLESLGVHKTALDGTSPATSILARFAENGHHAGVWECSPGKYRLERQAGALCVLLAGHWVLTGDEGDVYELEARDTILLKKGWKGLSNIVETIRKVYVTWD